MKTSEQQRDVREAKKRGQSVKTRILIHQREYSNSPKATLEKPRRRGQSVKPRILIHQREYSNSP